MSLPKKEREKEKSKRQALKTGRGRQTNRLWRKERKTAYGTRQVGPSDKKVCVHFVLLSAGYSSHKCMNVLMNAYCH